MILSVDNFLDNETFDILNASMLSKIDSAKSRPADDVGNEKSYSVSYTGLHGDILLPSMHLGVHIEPIIDNIVIVVTYSKLISILVTTQFQIKGGRSVRRRDIFDVSGKRR